MDTGSAGRGSVTRRPGGSMDLNWTFELSNEPVTTDEQDRFADDLQRLGIDSSVWDVFNTTLGTDTPDSRPLVVRAFEGSEIIGIAFIYECRKTGECFFNPPASTLYDIPGIPMFVWLRYGFTVDHFANPGFVVEGIERRTFVQRAIEYLLKQYMMGTVVEYATAPRFDGAVSHPFIDTGVIDTAEIGGIEDYVSRSKSLGRKLRKFSNKGGEIHVIEGALPESFKTAALDAFRTLDIFIRTPFQDNYLNMAGAVMDLDSSNMVHFIATLDGEYVGHQSFCRSGKQIHCQAGAFDRRRHTTYHSYENIIVSSVDYALRHGLQRIDYGPVLNETKEKMMTGFILCENRTYCRYGVMAKAMPLIIGRSKISPNRMARWCNLGVQPAIAPY